MYGGGGARARMDTLAAYGSSSDDEAPTGSAGAGASAAGTAGIAVNLAPETAVPVRGAARRGSFRLRALAGVD